MAAPDRSRPQGLARQRHARIPVCHRTPGFGVCRVRVSDLERNMGFVRVVGKGNKHRIVPVGKAALEAVEAYLEAAGHVC